MDKLTMLPISVVPRAKKKMTGLHPKRLYSLAVMPTFELWRATISAATIASISASGSAIGAAATKVARRVVRMAAVFILAVDWKFSEFVTCRKQERMKLSRLRGDLRLAQEARGEESLSEREAGEDEEREI